MLVDTTTKMRVKLLTRFLKNPIVVDLRYARSVQRDGKNINIFYPPATFFEMLFGMDHFHTYACNTEEEASDIITQYMLR